MTVFLRKRTLVIRGLYVLSILLLLPNFFSVHLVELNNEKNTWDTFNPQLPARIGTVNALLEMVDDSARESGVSPNSLPYLNILAGFMRQRFYHGYSHYSLRENWIAALAGALVSKDLSAIVIPEDIPKYPMAACSQQSILMMECLKRKGILFRKVIFSGHYAGEAFVGGRWYYYDTNLEPDILGAGRKSIEFILKNKQLPVVYNKTLDSVNIAHKMAFLGYGPVNAPPAPNAALFHKVTKWVSRLLWLLPLLIVLKLYKK